MKKLTILFLLLFVGCSSPTEPDDSITGKWEGRIYLSSTFDTHAFIAFEDNVGIGISRFYLGEGSSFFQAFQIRADLIGDKDSFAMLMDFGQNREPWRYTGYIDNDGRMCLNRDLYGDTTWCMDVVDAPTLDVSTN